MESKQPIPSVMARLMGFDELLPQQSSQKRPRVLSENYLQKVASIGVREKHSESHSFRLGVEEQKEYKDFFQALETSGSDKPHLVPIKKRELNSSSMEAKMSFRERDLLAKKHISADRELRGVPKTNNSSTNGFIKNLNEPRLQDVPSHLQSGKITVLESFHASDSKAKNSRKVWGFPRQWHTDSLKRVENGSGTQSCGKIVLKNLSKFPKPELNSTGVSGLPTSRIVVLKPILGKMDNVERGFSHEEVARSQHAKLHLGVRKRKNMIHGVIPVQWRSRSSKEITTRVGNGISSRSVETPRFEVFGSDNFSKECKMMASCLTNVSNRNRSDVSYAAKEAKQQTFQRWMTTKCFQQVELIGKNKTPGELLAMPDCEVRTVNYKPYKCGLRSKVKCFQQVELIGKNKTPGELLAMPDCEVRTVIYKPYKCGLRSKVSLNGVDRNCCIPSGMRCRNADVKNIPISSPLMNLNAVGSRSTRARHNSLRQGPPMIAQESIIMAWNNSMMQDSSQIHTSRCRNSASSFKLPQPIPYLDSESDNSAESKYAIQNEIENKLDEMHSSAQSSSVFKSSEQNMETFQDPCTTEGDHKIEDKVGYLPESSFCSAPAVNGVVDEVENTKTKFVQGLPPYLEVRQLESTKDGDPSSPLQDASNSIWQEIFDGISEGSVSSYCSYIDPDTDPESLMCLEDARPSPNSVLEPLYRKEISSTSDYFESSNVLDGLNMELETLKCETSEAYSEGSGMVSSDEDTGEGSIGYPEANEDMMRLSKVEDSRDFSYVVDLLNEAGINTSNLTSFVDALPANEYPINSSVFENLEKKYGKQLSWKRSDRKLLFDRINLGLMGMLQPSMGVLTWTKPVARRFNIGRGQETIEKELWMYLVSREKEASKESENFFGKEDRWLELEDDIQMIGIEMENSLVDELVADMLA